MQLTAHVAWEEGVALAVEGLLRPWCWQLHSHERPECRPIAQRAQHEYGHGQLHERTGREEAQGGNECYESVHHRDRELAIDSTDEMQRDRRRAQGGVRRLHGAKSSRRKQLL